MGRLGVVVLAVVVLAVAAPAGAVDGFTLVPPGLATFFPLAGNGGYDVTNYASGSATIRQPTTWMGR